MPKRRTKGDGGLSKRKSDGMWIGSIELPTGEDGRRRRRTVSSKDKGTALKKLRELRAQAEAGALVPANKLTVEAWLDRWIEEIRKPHIRPNTYDSYRSTIDKHIAPAIGAKKLSALTPADIRKVHKAVLDKKLSTRSAELAHTVLGAALKDAVREGVLSRNPAEYVPRPQVITESRGALTSEEAKQMLKYAIDNNDPYATRWAAALLLGIRQGELLGLRWQHINLDAGTFDIAWQLQVLPLREGAKLDDPERFDVEAGFEHIPLFEKFALTRPKTTRSVRNIPLPVSLWHMLRQYKQDAPVNRYDLLWATPQGDPIAPWTDSKRWHSALAAAGVRSAQLHAARGTTATLLLEAGEDAHVIQAILGHSSITVTRGYQHVSDELARSALANLGGLLPEIED